MTSTSEPPFLVLHHLSIKGFAHAHSLVPATGLPEPHVESVLQVLREQSWARYQERPRIGPWSPTPEGRTEHTRLVAVERASYGHAPSVEPRYREFLPLNQELLTVCTAWQVRDLDRNELNDHLDADYDASVVARLNDLHARALPLLVDLSHRLTRFGSYQARFEAALSLVDDGLTEYFTKPVIESYHTIWMELHQDLLVTCGIERSAEH